MDRTSSNIRFGLDGWHARLDGGFQAANVMRVADGLGQVWSDDQPGATVYVGYDLRPESRSMAREVGWTLASFGLDARLSTEWCPTPAVGYACSLDDACVGGVVVTGSKRSAEYDGILIRGPHGASRPTEFYERLERAIPATPGTARGPYNECAIMPAYLDGLKGFVDGDAIAAASLKAVVDPMYGSGTGYLARSLADLGVDVTEIHAGPRSDFGGLHPEPQDPWADECEQTVISQDANLGILLDGDADRAGVVDERGRILAPHQLVPLVLHHLVRNRGMGGRVVTTLSSSASTAKLARALGCPTTNVPVGFRRLYREMLVGDVLMAAEEYGGIAIPAHFNERDGLLVGLLVCELLAQEGKPLSQLVAEREAELGSYKYARRDIRLDPAVTQAVRNILPGFCPETLAGDKPVEVSHADGMRLDFSSGAWVLVRVSRASSVVRVYVEASTAKERDEKLAAACELVRNGL